MKRLYIILVIDAICGVLAMLNPYYNVKIIKM